MVFVNINKTKTTMHFIYYETSWNHFDSNKFHEDRIGNLSTRRHSLGMCMSYAMFTYNSFIFINIKFFLCFCKMQLVSNKSSVEEKCFIKIDLYFMRWNEWTIKLHCFLCTQAHIARKRHWHSYAHTSWNSFQYVYK